MKLNELLIHGGMAHSNGVSFYGKHYQSRATRLKNGEIQVVIDPLKVIPDWLNTMLGIPFLRGFADTMYAFYMKWWLGIIFMVAPVIMSVRMDALINMYSESGSHKGDFLSGLLTGVIMVAVVLQVSPMGKYHAAEHIMHNLYLQGQSISVEEGKKTSRVHEWCGTGCMVLLLTYTALMSFVPLPMWLRVILWFPFYGEVIMSNNKYIRFVLMPFKWLTYASQYLTTSKPKESHLEVSHKAFKTLLEKEESILQTNKLA